ncbi:pickpocket protein 28-like [Sitodiplosis mosellana]|uniref:pickpocket protein 28-like n=1 Tax=Sitodiplosis mosellana TaxID=263140 RepID=UPI002443E657|nr:pickpocket protein 28-like [Sitodiplosis mosellana]
MVSSYTIPNIEKPSDDTIECLECLPICSKTYFRVLPSYFELNKKGLEANNMPLMKNLSTYDNIAIVQIYYPLGESTLFSADVLMTWQEIVSNFGGLLGLCLGFSLVNIVEIVYFATIRLYQNISLVYDNANQNETPIHQKPKLTQEDKRICNMYVNDFKTYDRKIFHYRRT